MRVANGLRDGNNVSAPAQYPVVIRPGDAAERRGFGRARLLPSHASARGKARQEPRPPEAAPTANSSLSVGAVILFEAPRHRATNRGQLVIEFALVLPILLLVVFGITEFGRALMTVNVLNAAAREGARVAAVGGDSTSAVNRVVAVVQAGSIKNWAISVTHPDPISRAITVTVTTQFQALSAKIIPALIPPITLRGQTVMRFEG